MQVIEPARFGEELVNGRGDVDGVELQPRLEVRVIACRVTEEDSCLEGLAGEGTPRVGDTRPRSRIPEPAAALRFEVQRVEELKLFPPAPSARWKS